MGNLKILITIGIAGALLGCGQDPFKRQADPLDKPQYQELRNDKSFSRSAGLANQNMVGSVADILIDGNPGADTLQFYERHNKQYILEPRISEPEVDAFLKFPRLPSGMQVRQDGSRYILTWTPSVGVIPRDLKAWSQQIQVEIGIGPRTSAKALQNLSRFKANLVKTITIHVNYPQDQPTLDVRGLSGQKIKSDSVVKFTVLVKDPLAMKSREVVIRKLFDSSNISQERPRFNAVRAVLDDYSINNGQPKLENQVWTFHFILDMTLIPAEMYKDKKIVGGAFSLQTYNASALNLSEKYLVEFDLATEDSVPAKKE